MNKLQTVLDALEQWTDETPRCDLGALDAKIHEAIAIVKQMMQAEPEIEIGVNESSACRFLPVGTKLYTHPAPQALPVSDEHGNVKSSAGLIRDGKVDRFVKSYFAAPKAVPASNQPVAWRVWSPDGTNVYQYTEDGDGEPLFTAPQSVVADKPAPK